MPRSDISPSFVLRCGVARAHDVTDARWSAIAGQEALVPMAAALGPFGASCSMIVSCRTSTGQASGVLARPGCCRVGRAVGCRWPSRWPSRCGLRWVCLWCGIGEGRVRVINDSVARAAELTDEDTAAVRNDRQAELERRSECFRRGHHRMSLAGRPGSASPPWFRAPPTSSRSLACLRRGRCWPATGSSTT
jgi:hypothetical protein